MSTNDTISRAEAISRAVEIELFGRTVKVVAVSELEALPSAQPEIVHCRECKHFEEMEIFGKMFTMCKRSDHHTLPMDEDDYCSRAERRQDDTYDGLNEQYAHCLLIMPSAQPETHDKHTETHACDCIERQAAIDAISCDITVTGRQNAEVVAETIGAFVDRIKALPSAQTEVPKCKDCYWWTKQSDSLQGRCDRYGFYPTGYWYCAAARERREE